MTGWLLRLYPARWRDRYGDEFAAVLGERTLGPFDVLDILLGAIDAQLHLRGIGARSDHRKGFPMSLRLGGAAAMAGGALWLVAMTWILLFDSNVGSGAWVLLLLASVALLVGLAGLSAFQAREHPVLIWAAFSLPAIGALLTILGAAMNGSGNEYWYLLFILGMVATIVGSGLFALATWRSGALPRSGAAVLGIASLISFGTFAAESGLRDDDGMIALFVVGIGAFAVGWIVVGLQAIGMDRRVPAAGTV